MDTQTFNLLFTTGKTAATSLTMLEMKVASASSSHITSAGFHFSLLSLSHTHSLTRPAFQKTPHPTRTLRYKRPRPSSTSTRVPADQTRRVWSGPPGLEMLVRFWGGSGFLFCSRDDAKSRDAPADLKKKKGQSPASAATPLWLRIVSSASEHSLVLGANIRKNVPGQFTRNESGSATGG